MSGWELRGPVVAAAGPLTANVTAADAQAKVTELEMTRGWELRRPADGATRVACDSARRRVVAAAGPLTDNVTAADAQAKVTELEMT